MEGKNIEEKKLEIEKLKVKEGFIRTLAIILLTVGAGIGTGIKVLGIPKIWYEYVIALLGVVFFIIGTIFIFEVIDFKRKNKEIERWKK